MLNEVIMWIMDVAIFLFAIFQVKSGLVRIVGYDYKSMSFNRYHFALFYSKTSMRIQLFFWLLFIPLFAIVNISNLNILLLFSLPFILWHFILTIKRVFWRMEVDGDNVYVQTVLGKRNFLISDVVRIGVYNSTFLGIDSGFISHIILYSSRGRLVQIPVYVMHYSFLLDRLSTESIDGVKLIVDEFGQPIIERTSTLKPSYIERIYRASSEYYETSNEEATKFLLLFLTVLFGSIFLFIGPFFLDRVILRNAYSGQEVLVRFAIWVSMWIVSILISRIFFLQGNLFLLHVRKQRGKNIVLPTLLLIVMVILTRISVDFVLFHHETAHFIDVGDALADLRFINNNQLESEIMVMRLDTEHERFETLTSDAEFNVVYRIWISADWTLYLNFPREFRPADLRAQLQDEMFMVDENDPNHRLIRITYTPNMRMIMSVELITREMVLASQQYDFIHNIHITSNLGLNEDAARSFFYADPESEELVVLHQLQQFQTILYGYTGLLLETTDVFSFIDIDFDSAILYYTTEHDEDDEDFRRFRVAVFFEWDEPVYFDIEDEEKNQQLVRNHLFQEYGIEFRTKSPIYESSTAIPIILYSIDDPNYQVKLWLQVTSEQEVSVWAWIEV